MRVPHVPGHQLTKLAGLFAWAALALGAGACTKSSDDVAGLPPGGDLPDGGGGGGTVKELTLLLTGKVGGSLEPCG